MMKHGLLAPQFGLGRTTLSEFDVPARSLATVFESSPDESPSGPKVTFKRRRLVGLTTAAPVPSTVAASAPAAPRVYRLESPAATKEQHGVATDPMAGNQSNQRVAVPEVGHRAVRQQRRRRDQATRSPGAASHVVFSRPAKEDEPLGQPLSDEPVGLDTRAVSAALARLDATLASVARAQEAFRALDKLLTSLGVGGDAQVSSEGQRVSNVPAFSLSHG